MTKRAIGTIRVSEIGDRDAETFQSPDDQRARIEKVCEDNGWKLLDVYNELDVSGGKSLVDRTRLLHAIELIEDGKADVLVVAYFDRLVRSVKVQQEVIERVEKAGGDIHTVDFGRITNGSASTRLTSNMFGAVAQYFREAAAERSAAGQERSLKEGRWPVMLIPGLRPSVVGFNSKGQPIYGLPELDPDTHEAVTEAFRMRTRKEPIHAIRTHLREQGIDRSYHGTTTLLASRQALGELRFGEHFARFPEPHLIDLATFERVQKMVVSRGRKPKSDRLLARLGVVRCGNCGSRMVVGTVRDGSYPFYRCPPTGLCQKRVTVSAAIVEAEVIQAVKDHLLDLRGTASAESNAQNAAADLERAQAELDAAIRAFSGLDGEQAAIDRLQELRGVRDAARDRYDRLASDLDATSVAVTAGDWDDLSSEAKRNLIVAVIDQVRITSEGKGAERVVIEPKRIAAMT